MTDQDPGGEELERDPLAGTAGDLETIQEAGQEAGAEGDGEDSPTKVGATDDRAKEEDREAPEGSVKESGLESPV